MQQCDTPEWGKSIQWHTWHSDIPDSEANSYSDIPDHVKSDDSVTDLSEWLTCLCQCVADLSVSMCGWPVCVADLCQCGSPVCVPDLSVSVCAWPGSVCDWPVSVRLTCLCQTHPCGWPVCLTCLSLSVCGWPVRVTDLSVSVCGWPVSVCGWLCGWPVFVSVCLTCLCGWPVSSPYLTGWELWPT